MSDKPVVHIGENSPEHVAYELTQRIFTRIEQRNYEDITRKEFLDTYAECLHAVRGYRDIPKANDR